MNAIRANAHTSIVFGCSIDADFIILSIDISRAIYVGLPLQRLAILVFPVNTRVWIILDRASPDQLIYKSKGFL